MMILGDRVEGGTQQINTGSCQVRFVSSYYCQVFCTPQGEQEKLWEVRQEKGQANFLQRQQGRTYASRQGNS